MTRRSRTVRLALLAAVAAPAASAQEERGPFAQLEFRNVGPVNLSGRVTDVEGVPEDPRVIWVGAASGGVWRSGDGGVTFQPIFDEQPIASIGDIGLAPSNPEVAYVGTGESNVRSSVSFGNGVYKTTDGGQSWSRVGLEKTQGQRGGRDRLPGLYHTDLRVDPQDPDRVCAVSSLLQRSIDGGKSFERISESTHVDFHSLWIDPVDPKRIWQGQDGGIAVSYDGAET